MRLLHAGHLDVVYGLSEAQSARLRSRNPRRLERPPLPLHRLCRHRRRDQTGGEGQINSPPAHARSAWWGGVRGGGTFSFVPPPRLTLLCNVRRPSPPLRGGGET